MTTVGLLRPRVVVRAYTSLIGRRSHTCIHAHYSPFNDVTPHDYTLLPKTMAIMMVGQQKHAEE